MFDHIGIRIANPNVVYLLAVGRSGCLGLFPASAVIHSTYIPAIGCLFCTSALYFGQFARDKVADLSAPNRNTVVLQFEQEADKAKPRRHNPRFAFHCFNRSIPVLISAILLSLFGSSRSMLSPP